MDPGLERGQRMLTAAHIRAALMKATALPLEDEKRLQEVLLPEFEAQVSLSCDVVREYRIGPGSIIDFAFIGRDWVFGLEVKTRTRAKRAVLRQVERYAQTGVLDHLFVLAATALGLPRQLAGIGVDEISLGEVLL